MNRQNEFCFFIRVKSYDFYERFIRLMCRVWYSIYHGPSFSKNNSMKYFSYTFNIGITGQIILFTRNIWFIFIFVSWNKSFSAIKIWRFYTCCIISIFSNINRSQFHVDWLRSFLRIPLYWHGFFLSFNSNVFIFACNLKHTLIINVINNYCLSHGFSIFGKLN